MDPKKPIQSGISDISDIQPKPFSRRSLRERFFDTLKTKYPNIQALYVTINIIAIWSGVVLISDSWAQGTNLLDEPAPDFALKVVMRHFALLMLGLLMLWIDDLSLQELVVMKKTPIEKDFEEMNSREKLFYHFKTKYPNLSTMYTLIAIIISWCGIWGLLWDIPIQPFWRSLMTIFIGFFLLYIDDFKLDELN
ncbi:hypothetical protein BJP34_02655 [Moorena producens PAL-8-15-08-1]|uniref:Uncharacterized protein n=1 Tax=Moorena producens PAL-8-15-08-1 TaxID=1458985 RepID=A0A1D8TLN9_9CYAN|nr:hypothetical protein [Moorena producens]AOW98492.1 hypothetical protein BJP34_02655 [Moorena producens PAL-8-15-08-1]